MGIGAYRHIVEFESPGDPVPDGEGGYVEGWAPLVPPTWAVSIVPASVRDLERETSGTVLATATHIVSGRYRPDVTTEARMKFEGRVFEITGAINVDERDIEMKLICKEHI
jgi:head-tail adaptor